jgi:uncharacterized LabA/DUF88 family protein
MAGRPIRSALLIDIENVSYARLSTSIPNWLAWLEHGQFDPAKQRRKFVLKRAYWNSTSEHDRRKFESRGVDAILVDRYVTLKNTADVHMAIDIIELLYTRPDIEEYVLLSKDSDFIPVMQRLRSNHKKTAMLVDLASPTLHTAFRDKVDIVIPHRDLLLATAYNPPMPKLGIIGRWRAKLATKREQSRIERRTGHRDGGEPSAVNGASATVGRADAGPATPLQSIRQPAGKLPDGSPLTQATMLVGALLMPSRGLYVPQKAILAQLHAIPEFTELGTAKYLGAGSYHALMSHLATYDPLMKVDKQNGGHTAVRYLSAREQAGLKLAADQAKLSPQTKSGRGRTRGAVAAALPPPVEFTAEQDALLHAAIVEVRRLAQQRPGAYLPRHGLLEAIGSVPGIRTAPPDQLLGTASLNAFMFEVARRDPEFFISEETGGGKGFRYLPRYQSKPPAALWPATDEPTPVPSLPPLLTAMAGNASTASAAPPRAEQFDAPPGRSLETAAQADYEPHSDSGQKRWDLT